MGASLNEACVSGGALGSCCGSSCVDYKTSSANCGSCGHACSGSEFCDQGTCKPTPTCTLTNNGATCPVGNGRSGSCCGGACVDSSRDNTNCGTCNVACASGSVCSAGKCVSAVDGGQIYCHTPTGLRCPTGMACEFDKCVPYDCAPGSSGGACAFGEPLGTNTGYVREGQCCQGRCVDLSQDPQNCGACGTPCTNGLCQAPRASSSTAAGICVPLMPNCSSAICGNGAFCLDGMCNQNMCTSGPGSLCLAGTSIGKCCGLSPSSPCVDLNTDPMNCGACAVVCPAGGSCVGGVCQGTSGICARGDVGRFCGGADAGETAVCCPGGGCVDVTSDSANCGHCGWACTNGTHCSAARCVP